MVRQINPWHPSFSSSSSGINCSTPFSAKTGGKSVARRVLQDFGGKRMEEVTEDETRTNQAAISNLDTALAASTPSFRNLS